MRTTCLLCVRKHLGKAEALMNEARLGYPAHAGLAIGNLSEAADESLQDFPRLSAEIRDHWKAYELDEEHYEVPTVELLKKLEELLAEVRRQQLAEDLKDAAAVLDPAGHATTHRYASGDTDKRQPPASDRSEDRGKSQRLPEGARDRAPPS